MKILFYINVLSGGGAERVIANLSNQFAASGDSVVLVTTYKTDNEYYVNSRVKRIYLEKATTTAQNRLVRNVSRIRKLRKTIKREMPNVIVSFMEEPNFRSLIATRGLNVSTIVSVRNDPKREYHGIVGNFIAKCLMPLADGCVFQTEDARAYFSPTMKKKSEIIVNEVKDSFFSINRKPNAGRIVTLGRLTEQKNHRMLINAFAKVAQRYPYACLDIYGEGPLKDTLAELIDDLGLNNKVSLKGNTTNPEEVLATTDIFVLSSNYEGMPNALMEAMAAGLPCISTDCPCGGPRMLIDGNNGKLVSVGEECEMIEMLEYLLENDDIKKTIGDRAKTSAANYKPDRIFGLWKSYIERVINDER